MSVALRNGCTLEDIQQAFPEWVRGKINRLPTNKMFGVLMTVTPEMAQIILDRRNIAEEGQEWRNRRMCETVVKKYTSDMEKGNWLATPQGISFSDYGKLIDGQHRLRSIIRSGVPQEIFVVFNVKNCDEVMHVLDSGKNRTMSDRFYVAGEEVNKAIIAISRTAMRRADSVGRPVSVTDHRDFILRYKDELESVFEWLECDRKDDTMKGICIPPCQAAFFKALLAHPERKEELRVLANAFRTNDTAEVPAKWRNGIKYLRKRVRDSQGYGGTANKQKYFLVQYWLKGYFEDKVHDENHILRVVKRPEEQFPVEGCDY